MDAEHPESYERRACSYSGNTQGRTVLVAVVLVLGGILKLGTVRA